MPSSRLFNPTNIRLDNFVFCIKRTTSSGHPQCGFSLRAFLVVFCELWFVCPYSCTQYTLHADTTVYIHFALNGLLGDFLPGAIMICGAKHIWKHICYRCLCKGCRVTEHGALVDSAKQFSNVVMPI